MESNYNNPSQDWNTPANDPYPQPPVQSKRILAGIMAILFGGLGVHKFIMGYNNEGVILLLITLVSIPLTCIIIGAFTIYIPFIIGLIEGIIYLTKTDQEFNETYIKNKRNWF